MTENQNDYRVQESAPNSTGALVLGIISIVTCWLWGVIGVVCGIIAIVLANKSIIAYNLDPNMYTISSLKNAKAGKVCGIIGLCISALFLLYMIVVIGSLGLAVSNGVFNK